MALLDDLLSFLKLKAKKDTLPSIQEKPNSLKFVTNMLNSISFSTDMRFLYIIDNGRAFTFDLESKTGVLIGTLGNQITAVTALEAPDLEDTPLPDGEQGASANRIAALKPVKITTVNKHWTTVFNQDKLALSVVGATDIDLGIANAPSNPVCEVLAFDLKSNLLQVRKTGTTIELTPKFIRG
ncbi:MAG TPA: hypothetical protein PKE06_14595 [Flavilitoribacter sp.]|nr:hypothetical protein [Flavilitoribacter sp.]HMQ86368.1 hypothetical protein [Flavilitoribacter sp.]